MKKVVILISIVAIVSILVLVLLLKSRRDSDLSEEEKVKEESSEETEVEKPPIVDHFACSDYCPGPEEDYMVKIYEGIEDEEECRRLGGTPSSYTGWGTTKICLVE